MKICLLVLWGDSLTYTIAKALAFNDHQVQVWVTDTERHKRAVWGIPQRIAAIPGVSVVAGDTVEPPEQFDQLIVQGHRLLLGYRHVLDRLAPRTIRITAISSGDRSRPYRQAFKLQWSELCWYGRWSRKVKRVAYKDGYYPVDLFGSFKLRQVVGFDAHSKFLQDEALFRAIHAQDWNSDSSRPIRANFLGSRDPASRGQILDSIDAYFIHPSPGDKQKKHMVWHVYSDARPAALSPVEFLETLVNSDFTLSPPGYSLVTHRPVEALLRGSIPVINADELDLYDLGLVDGVNCIAVSSGGWPAAMDRITHMDEGEIVAMRRNILAMLTDRVTYPALSRNICRRLGLDV
jgi:hypothetical protein